MLARTATERNQIAKLMRAHTSKMRADRAKFYARRTHAGVNPNLQWTILSDSTSGYIYISNFFFFNIVLIFFHFSFALPHISPLPKGWGSIRRLPIGVFGLINYALGYRALYPYPPEWPQTPNFTISLMYNHFYRMFSIPDHPRAPELNETSDGSPKEYKNSVYLAFAALKIIIGWFERVNHFFLGPGHSHEEQDGIWHVLKNGFYQSRVGTFARFVTLCTQAFQTAKPEVITKFPVFDWETWLRPWMLAIHHHSKWRAFQFTRLPHNPNAVLMKWKECESTPGDFHGSASHPDGIELLLELPSGTPNRIISQYFRPHDIADIPKCFNDLNPDERMYWEEVLNESMLSDNTSPPVPDDYFDFDRLSYNTWHTAHPDTFQHPLTMPTTFPAIDVDETIGNFFFFSFTIYIYIIFFYFFFILL